MKIVLNAYPENLKQPGHGYGVSTHAIVYKGHGLGIVSLDDDTFI